MTKASLTRRNQAEFLAKELVNALKAHQMEKRGYSLQDANSYTVGYLESMLASMAAQSPKGLEQLISTLQMVKERTE